HPRADPDARVRDALRLRPGLARRRDRREPPDVVPDAALRIRAVLPARGRAARDQDGGHLSWGGAVRRAAAHRADARDRVPRSRQLSDPRAALISQLASSGNAITSVSPMSRSEEHTSELQSRSDPVCRLLLEKKKKS